MMDISTRNNSKKKRISVFDMTQVALFAALIFTSILIRINLGFQMVHFGNAMVLIGALVLGSKKGAAAASIGLFLFDASHGYLAVAWITVLESLIICLMVYLLFEKGMKYNDKIQNIIIVAVTAAITKVVVNLLKYTFLYGMIRDGLAMDVSFWAALGKITGSYGSAILTIITVPILYPPMKKIVSKTSQMARR